MPLDLFKARVWGVELVVRVQTIGSTFLLENESEGEKFYEEGRILKRGPEKTHHLLLLCFVCGNGRATSAVIWLWAG